MTKHAIIEATQSLTPLERIEIRDALLEQIEKDKQAYIAEGEKIYGRKTRKPRVSTQPEQE
jgi:hypothetical protein